MRRGLVLCILSLAALATWEAPRAAACCRVDFITVALRSPVCPCGPVVQAYIRGPLLRVHGGPGLFRARLRAVVPVVGTPPGPPVVVLRRPAIAFPPVQVTQPPTIQVPPGAPPVVFPPAK